MHLYASGCHVRGAFWESVVAKELQTRRDVDRSFNIQREFISCYAQRTENVADETSSPAHITNLEAPSRRGGAGTRDTRQP